MAGVTDSLPLEVEAVKATVGGRSSSVIVPTPWPSKMVAPLALERLTKKVSLASSRVSPLTWTVMVWVVTPAANVNEPLVAV